MYNNVVYSGCSSAFLEQELTKVKGLLTKVNLMKKPDNPYREEIIRHLFSAH